MRGEGDARLARLEGEPPASRDSVIQAMSCLSTEILYDSPEDVLEAVLKHVSEDDLAGFITVHPSSLLRAPDEESRRQGYDAFVADLKAARRLAGSHRKAA